MSKGGCIRDTRQASQVKVEKARRNYEAFDGKRALLKTYEDMGIENDDVRQLRKRVRRKQLELINRGADALL